MKKNIPKVISLVVEQDLCTGCGLCINECSNKSLSMQWNEYGFLTPKLKNHTCTSDGECITVCPFNPFPEDETKTEDEIAKIFFLDTKFHNPIIGNYEGLFVGHSKKYRKTSSSGGIATYTLEKLFEKKIIDAAVVVSYSNNNDSFFNYNIIHSKEELINASKTRYFPVTLAVVMEEINKINGKLAIVGVACFVKALRLKQKKNLNFNNKIKFIIGIICGGLKSKYYTDYLASKTINTFSKIKNPKYRIKNIHSNAFDYSFGITYKMSEYKLEMKKVGDMWGTGFFKNNACDFCDDVTTELADISLGDAWIEPYVNDGKGNNIIIIRSKAAYEIIKNGISKKEIILEKISIEKVVESQKGSFNHRHKGLLYRINKRKKDKLLTPPKRKRFQQKISLHFKIVQFFRGKTREKSLLLWKIYKDARKFDEKMKIWLFLLKISTKLYHKISKKK